MTALMSSIGPLYQIFSPAQLAMPRSQIKLGQFRDEIKRRVTLKHTQPEILNWLTREGVIISRNTLSSQVNTWATDRSKTASLDAILMSTVNTAFHIS
jgi:hypothetical protein